MGYIFLALFAVTLFMLYIAVRRSWGPTLYLGGVGAILCTVFVILYSLVHEETSVAQAVFAGLVVGLGFSVTTVIIAAFFRTNQPGADVRIVSEHQHDQQPPEQ